MNISWSPKGETIAVGNKDDLISFIDCKNYKIRLEKQFKEIDSKVSSRASRYFVTSLGTCSRGREVVDWTEIESFQV